MASLIKRIKKGKPYYYIVESKRINGKPRIVKQIYLGTLEKILETHKQHTAPTAKEVELTHIGPMALWDVAVSLGLPEMIDKAFPKRRQGPNISQFLLLAALGRAFA
ncbi:MAG: IS1634 family transposase, partial [Nitrososphaera sp.]